MKTILANMRHAVRNRETVTIGGGTFDAGELQEVILALEGREQLEKEVERLRTANRVLDDAAKDAQAWAYQVQQLQEELQRTKRNLLRRMAQVLTRRLWRLSLDEERRMAKEPTKNWHRRHRMLWRIKDALNTTPKETT